MSQSCQNVLFRLCPRFPTGRQGLWARHQLYRFGTVCESVFLALFYLHCDGVEGAGISG
jgi:hypothetical protein